MRNAEQWQPSRFVPGPRGYAPSPDPKRIHLTSRYVAGVQIKAYEPLLRGHARGRLLDLGCGVAPYYGLYRDRIDSCICLDWPTSLHENPYLDVHADLNRPLPLADATMDTVLLTDVLEHVARPEPLIRETARVLRPGGKLVVTVPFFYRLHEEPHDYRRYTEHALRHLCGEAGLDVVHLEPYGGLPEIVCDLLNKSIVFSRLVSGALLRLSRAFTALGPVRRISRRSARTFPLGYCLVAAAPSAPTVSTTTRPMGVRRRTSSLGSGRTGGMRTSGALPWPAFGESSHQPRSTGYKSAEACWRTSTPACVSTRFGSGTFSVARVPAPGAVSITRLAPMARAMAYAIA